MARVWFTSRCKPVSVHDGDTFHIPYADLGWGHRQYPLGYDPDDPAQKPGVIAVRLIMSDGTGCNARELGMPGGPEARDALAAILGTGYVKLQTERPDAFGGRIEAAPFVPDPNVADGWLDVCKLLVEQQWLASWSGRGTKVLPPWPRTA